MRYRVNTRFGYASFGEDDKEKALALYVQEGLSLRLCKDISDEGDVIAGLPFDIETKDWVSA